MSRLCPNGHEVKDNLRFCPVCGAELQEKTMKFCKKCGNERKGTEKFCSKCGTPFESVESPRQTQQYSPSYAETEDTSNNQKYIIPIIIGVAILALIGGGWWYFNSTKSSPMDNNAVMTDSIAVVDSVAVYEAVEAVEEIVDTIATDNSPNADNQSDLFINGHKAIDLGLSVYWAECNIGATSYEGYGDYISWGETNSKDTYTESSYAGTDYDAAHSRWGDSWRLPTKKEFEEMIHKCKWSWTSNNGIKGYDVHGTNGNSIFLPAAGQIRNSSHHWIEERGYYWTSTKGSTSQYAYYLVFAPFVADGVLGTESDNGYDFRYWGYSIRPVIDK